jgi:hypothetical protein
VTTIEILDVADPSDPPPGDPPLAGCEVAMAMSMLIVLAVIVAAVTVASSGGNDGSGAGDGSSDRAAWETEQPPAGVDFDLVEATPSGIRLVRLDEDRDNVDLAGPASRLAFGFDGPVIVHQPEFDVESIMIRITTPTRTDMVPSDGLSRPTLLDVAVLDGHRTVLWAGQDRVTKRWSLSLFDLETKSTQRLGDVPGWVDDAGNAYLNDEQVWVWWRDETGEPVEDQWDLNGASVPVRFHAIPESCDRTDHAHERPFLCMTSDGTFAGFRTDGLRIVQGAATWRVETAVG